ncbi:MAG: tetratricopeptide repeat protein [Planctomycetota bacterium]
MCTRSLPLLILVLFLTFASGAAAKDAKAPAGYTEAINQALSELEAMNYPEALAEFSRAHEIFPNARTLRGLGMVEFELRHYAESKRLLEQALASAVKPLDEKLRSETESLLDRARRYVSDLFVKLEPATASLTIDGRSPEYASNGSLQLEVGEHVLEARASGRATERRTLNVKGGERLDVKLSLESLAQPAPVVAAPVTPASDPVHPRDASSDKPAYKKWWLWTTVIVVAAGGATAAALLLRDHHSKTEPLRGTNATSVTLQSLRSF